MNGKNSVPQIISASLSILPWPAFFIDVLLYNQMKVNKYDSFPTDHVHTQGPMPLKYLADIILPIILCEKLDLML
jgi:hypothetical protein